MRVRGRVRVRQGGRGGIVRDGERSGERGEGLEGAVRVGEFERRRILLDGDVEGGASVPVVRRGVRGIAAE